MTVKPLLKKANEAEAQPTLPAQFSYRGWVKDGGSFPHCRLCRLQGEQPDILTVEPFNEYSWTLTE